MKWNQSRQLKRDSRKIYLDPKKKHDIKTCLLTVVYESEPDHTVSQDPVYRSRFFMLKPLPLALAIVILLSTGTVYAAEASVPGDMLYKVKTNTEGFRSLFARGDFEEASWEAQMYERRVQEMERLNQMGRLTPEAEEALEKQFQLHREKCKNKLLKLKEAEQNDEIIDVHARLEMAARMRAQIDGSDFDQDQFDRKMEILEQMNDPEFIRKMEARRAELQQTLQAKYNAAQAMEDESLEVVEEIPEESEIGINQQVDLDPELELELQAQ